AKARAGGLRHLAIDESGLGISGIARLNDTRLRHFQPQVIAFARTFADTGKDGIAAVILRDVVDEFHDDDGLADAGATEQTDLAALEEGLNEVDDFNAGLKHLGFRGLLV